MSLFTKETAKLYTFLFFAFPWHFLPLCSTKLTVSRTSRLRLKIIEPLSTHILWYIDNHPSCHPIYPFIHVFPTLEPVNSGFPCACALFDSVCAKSVSTPCKQSRSISTFFYLDLKWLSRFQWDLTEKFPLISLHCLGENVDMPLFSSLGGSIAPVLQRTCLYQTNKWQRREWLVALLCARR